MPQRIVHANHLRKKQRSLDSTEQLFVIEEVHVGGRRPTLRPIAKLSNRALLRHGNEAYYAKALFFLFTFSEFKNASRLVLQHFWLVFCKFSGIFLLVG